jgi:hypothetical protein
MITDTCSCGARFTTNQKYWSEQSNDHKAWLEAHAVCRMAKKPANNATESGILLDEAVELIERVLEWYDPRGTMPPRSNIADFLNKANSVIDRKSV